MIEASFNDVVEQFEQADRERQAEFERLTAENAFLKAELAVTKIRVLELREGDVLVLKAPGRICMETADQLTTLVESRFPGHKFLVLPEGLDLSAVREVKGPDC